MSRIFRHYQKLLAKYPLGVQSLQAGALMATGDQIAQNFVERRKFQDLDFGPTTRTWYVILNKYIGSSGGTVAVKKVIVDQVLFAPILITVLLSTIAAFQEHDIESIKQKLKNEYPDVLKNNYKLWPMVQLVNFYFVPLQYQVLVVQTVAVFWNTYISYRTNINDDH